MTETTQTTAPPPPPPTGRPRLERSRTDKVIAGVCGGIARYFGIDAVLVRIVVVAAMVFGGFGAVAYLAAWLLIPEQGASRPLLGSGEQRQTVQVVAVVAVVLVVLASFGLWAGFGFFASGWPLLFLLAGGAVLWFVIEREQPGAVGAGPGGSGGLAADGTALDGEDGEGAAGEETAPRGGSWAVTAIATGAVLLLVGAAAALDALDVVDLGWGGVAAVAILATGVALVGAAFYGGARLLIGIGLLLAVTLGSAAATGVSLNGGIGRRAYAITDGDDLRGRYELGIGHLRLDLRGVELARGTTRIEADVDVGVVEVLADDGRLIDGDASWDDDGEGASGVDIDRTIVVGGGDRRLEIDAHTGIGVVTVNDRPGDADWRLSGSTLALPDGACAPLGPLLRPAPCEAGRDDA